MIYCMICLYYKYVNTDIHQSIIVICPLFSQTYDVLHVGLSGLADQSSQESFFVFDKV